MDKSGVFQEAKFYEQIREELRYKPELLAKDAAFCWWFIHFQTGDNVKSSNAITGRGGDKNIDALWIDEKEKIVNVLQGKLRTKFGKSSEKRNDLTGLLDLTDVFYNDEARKNLTKKLPAKIIQKIDDGVNRVKRGYKIRLWYITTGKVSETYKEEFVEKATLKTGNPELRIFDYKNIKSCYLDWKDNIFPAVVDYTLPIDSANFSGGGYINRSDNKYNLDTWICTVLSTELKKMYETLGDAIFSRNVRGYLGDKGINAELTQTVKNEPEKFWYYNNGITMICRDCEHKVKHSKPVLEISRPQIVNGLQTTKSLANEADPLASVLLKVINIGEGTTNTNFVHKIVQATNKQNPVSNEDLASNDDVQIELWRNFDRVDCLYIRKRGETVTQIENRYGYKADLTFSKYDLAKAVAACTMDPQIPRKGPNLIFDQSRTGKYYKQIFKSKSSSNEVES